VSLNDWDEGSKVWQMIMGDNTRRPEVLLIAHERRDAVVDAARKHRFHQPIAATSTRWHTRQTRPSIVCSSRKASGADSTYLPS
jgi:hypothetical protein